MLPSDVLIWVLLSGDTVASAAAWKPRSRPTVRSINDGTRSLIDLYVSSTLVSYVHIDGTFGSKH